MKNYLEKIFKHISKIPRRIEFKTADNEYYIRRKLGRKNTYIVVQSKNPIEDEQNTFSGTFNECKNYLISKGYNEKDVIKYKR